MTSALELRPVGYDHPDAQALTDAAQRFYVEIYGGPDETPARDDDFAPPVGGFLVGYLDGHPVAMGGWRFTPATIAKATRPAEIKRMFVRSEVRGRGFARAVLAGLEASAAAAGADWMVLETGRPQVAAIALYRGCGYGDIAPFGFYAENPDVVTLGKPCLQRKR